MDLAVLENATAKNISENDNAISHIFFTIFYKTTEQLL